MHTWNISRVLALSALACGYAQTAMAAEQAQDMSAELHAKFAKNVTYSSARAAEIVKSFEVDCRARDGRYLPLLNILYVSIAAAGDKWQTKYYVENRGDNVRIIEHAYFPDGREMQGGGVKFEINEWGELIPHGITTEAILNACYGSYGPIWVVPKPTTKK